MDEDDAGTYKCRANVFETAEAAEKNIEVEVSFRHRYLSVNLKVVLKTLLLNA